MIVNIKVGLMVGRFQPLTKAHTNIIEQISKENDKAIIFVIKSNNDKSPFNESLQEQMLESIKPDNVEIVRLKDAFFVDYINLMFESDFTLYCGTDRIKGYTKMASYISNDKYLTIKEITRTDEDISATMVRESLKNDDYEKFKSLTDKRIHNMYNTLKEVINEETVSGDIAPFTKPVDSEIDKRPSFKEFMKKKKKDTKEEDVLQKQQD